MIPNTGNTGQQILTGLFFIHTKGLVQGQKGFIGEAGEPSVLSPYSNKAHGLGLYLPHKCTIPERHNWCCKEIDLVLVCWLIHFSRPNRPSCSIHNCRHKNRPTTNDRYIWYSHLPPTINQTSCVCPHTCLVKILSHTCMSTILGQ
jgi:hypothetical protein